MADNTRKTSNIIHEVSDLKDQMDKIQDKIESIDIGDAYISTINNTKPDENGDIGIVDAGNVDVSKSGNNITLAVDLSGLADKGDIPTVNDGKINLQASNGVKLAAGSQNATANQSGTSTFKVEADLEYLNANLDIPEDKSAANDGQINMTGGTGIDVTGQNATANQANNTAWNVSIDNTVALKSDIPTIPPPVVPGDGSISLNAGDGMTVSGSNATANQDGNTAWTVKTDNTYLNANLDFAKPDDIPTQYVKDIQSGNLLTLTVDEEDGVYTLTAIGGGGSGGTGDIAFGEGQCIEIETETAGDLTTYIINCDLECLEANLNFVKPDDLPDIPDGTLPISSTDGTVTLDSPSANTFAIETASAQRLVVDSGKTSFKKGHYADFEDANGTVCGRVQSSSDRMMINALNDAEIWVQSNGIQYILVDPDKQTDGVKFAKGATTPFVKSPNADGANIALADEATLTGKTVSPLRLSSTTTSCFARYSFSGAAYSFFAGSTGTTFNIAGGVNGNNQLIIEPDDYVKIPTQLQTDTITTKDGASGDATHTLSGKTQTFMSDKIELRTHYQLPTTNSNADGRPTWTPEIVPVCVGASAYKEPLTVMKTPGAADDHQSAILIYESSSQSGTGYSIDWIGAAGQLAHEDDLMDRRSASINVVRKATSGDWNMEFYVLDSTPGTSVEGVWRNPLTITAEGQLHASTDYEPNDDNSLVTKGWVTTNGASGNLPISSTDGTVKLDSPSANAFTVSTGTNETSLSVNGRNVGINRQYTRSHGVSQHAVADRNNYVGWSQQIEVPAAIDPDASGNRQLYGQRVTPTNIVPTDVDLRLYDNGQIQTSNGVKSVSVFRVNDDGTQAVSMKGFVGTVQERGLLERYNIDITGNAPSRFAGQVQTDKITSKDAASPSGDVTGDATITFGSHITVNANAAGTAEELVAVFSSYGSTQRGLQIKNGINGNRQNAHVVLDAKSDGTLGKMTFQTDGVDGLVLDNNTLTVSTGGSEKVEIDNLGRVKLLGNAVVSDEDFKTYMQFNLDPAVAGEAYKDKNLMLRAGQSFMVVNSDATVRLVNNAVLKGAADDSAEVAFPTDGSFTVSTGGKERVRVRGDGMVGVGYSGQVNIGLAIYQAFETNDANNSIEWGFLSAPRFDDQPTTACVSVESQPAFKGVVANEVTHFRAEDNRGGNEAFDGKQNGFLVGSIDKSNTGNTGFRSGVNAVEGKDNYAFVASGTAPSYFQREIRVPKLVGLAHSSDASIGLGANFTVTAGGQNQFLSTGNNCIRTMQVGSASAPALAFSDTTTGFFFAPDEDGKYDTNASGIAFTIANANSGVSARELLRLQRNGQLVAWDGYTPTASSSIATKAYVDANAGGGGSSGVNKIIAGSNVTVSPLDGTGNVTVNAVVPDVGVTKIIGGTNVTVSPADGTGTVTINATSSGGGGADSLVDLDDVVVTDPKGNEVLTYDITTGKWINKAPPSGGNGGIIDGGQVPGTGSTFIWHDTKYSYLRSIDGEAVGGYYIPEQPRDMVAYDGVFSDGTFWTLDGVNLRIDPNATTGTTEVRYVGKFRTDNGAHRPWQGRVIAGQFGYWFATYFSQDMKQWGSSVTSGWNASDPYPCQQKQRPLSLSVDLNSQTGSYIYRYVSGTWEEGRVNSTVWQAIFPGASSQYNNKWTANQFSGQETAMAMETTVNGYDYKIYCLDVDPEDFEWNTSEDSKTPNDQVLKNGTTAIPALDGCTCGFYSERIEKWFFAKEGTVYISNTSSLKGGFITKTLPRTNAWDRCYDDGSSIVFARTGLGNSATVFSVDGGQEWKVSISLQNRGYSNFAGTNGRAMATYDDEDYVEGFIPDPADPSGEGVLPVTFYEWRYAVSGVDDPNPAEASTRNIKLTHPVSISSAKAIEAQTQEDANEIFTEEIQRRSPVMTLTQVEYDAIPADEIDDNTLYLITS